MMQDIEEEEVHFDQAGLLDNRKKRTKSSLWCRSLVKIVCLSLAFLSLGLCIAIPGPTLLDLGERVNTDTTHMALIFSARSLGYLLGAVIGGFLFDIFNKHLLLCSTLFLAALATSIIPWALTLAVLAVMFSLQGVAMGVLDTGGNALCVRIWGKKSSPYMQAMHFAFGIGAFIAPLLSQPFLSSLPSHNHTVLQGNVPVLTNIGTLLTNKTIINPSKPRIKRDHILNHTMLVDFNQSTSAPFTTEMTTQTSAKTTVATNKKPLSATDNHSESNTADGKQLKNVKEQQRKNEQTATTKAVNKTTNKPTVKQKDQESIPALLEKANTTISSNSSDFTDNSTISMIVSLDNGTSLVPTPSVTSSNSVKSTAKPILTTKETTTTTALPTTMQELSTTTKSTTTLSTTTTATTEQTTSTPKQSTSTLPKSSSSASTTTSHSSKASDTGHDTGKEDGKSHSKSHAIIETTANLVNQSSAEITTMEMATKPTVTSDINTLFEAVKHMSKIQFSYMIIAAMLVVNAVIFLVLYCFDKKTGGVDAMMAEREKHYHIQSSCIRIFILVVMFLFFLSYSGMETTFGGLIMTFTVEYMDWTKEQGAIVTAIFWGSLAAGRGFAIFIAGCCKPRCMLIVDVILVILGASILSFVVKAFSFILWVGCLAIGLGMSSIFPTGISWTEQYFRMTGKSTAVLVMGSALGQMTIPVLTGYAFQNINKMYLMYVVLILSIFCSLLFMIMQILASKCGGTTDLRSENGFLPLSNDDSLEMDGLNLSYGTSQEFARRRLLPNFNDNGYDRLPQDAENEIDDLLS